MLPQVTSNQNVTPDDLHISFISGFLVLTLTSLVSNFARELDLMTANSIGTNSKYTPTRQYCLWVSGGRWEQGFGLHWGLSRDTSMVEGR